MSPHRKTQIGKPPIEHLNINPQLDYRRPFFLSTGTFISPGNSLRGGKAQVEVQEKHETAAHYYVLLNRQGGR